jgi:3-dehydroquinate synthase
MQTLEHEIRVTFRYPVYFSRDVFVSSNPLVLKAAPSAVAPKPARILFVLDGSVAEAHPGLQGRVAQYCRDHAGALELAAPVLVIPGGEQCKNDHAPTDRVLQAIHDASLDRHSYVGAIGGGAVLDVVGYAAAMAHRGIRLIRFPTTVLAQDDSAVGVKNGINAFGKKNFIGTFAVPFAVVNDFAMLASLTPRDKRAGYIEAVKVACIRDAAFFDEIERNATRLRNFEPDAMERLIYRCAELHINHIATSGDPFELGSARPLDFGHWSAHKLEQISDYKIRHGEAVAVGIALDTVYARRKGLLDAASAERVLRLIEELGFDTFSNELFHVDSTDSLIVLRGLEEFREHLGGELTITLLKAIGQGIEVHEMDDAVIVEAIQELHTRHCQRAAPLPSSLSTLKS